MGRRIPVPFVSAIGERYGCLDYHNSVRTLLVDLLSQNKYMVCVQRVGHLDTNRPYEVVRACHAMQLDPLFLEEVVRERMRRAASRLRRGVPQPERPQPSASRTVVNMRAYNWSDSQYSYFARGEAATDESTTDAGDEGPVAAAAPPADAPFVCNRFV